MLVMACTLGVITAEMRLWKLVIGLGTSIPAALFLAMFCLSNWSTKRVLASIRLSIFYGRIEGERDLFTDRDRVGQGVSNE